MCVCVRRIEGIVVAQENEEVLLEAWRQEEQIIIEKQMKVTSVLYHLVLHALEFFGAIPSVSSVMYIYAHTKRREPEWSTPQYPFLNLKVAFQGKQKIQQIKKSCFPLVYTSLFNLTLYFGLVHSGSQPFPSKCKHSEVMVIAI